MSKGRRRLNISLIILSIMLAGWAVWIYRQPSPSYINVVRSEKISPDTASIKIASSDLISSPAATLKPTDNITDTTPTTAYKHEPATPVVSTQMCDADVRYMTGSHPFSAEARKVLSGNLEESDSLSRHMILSYCEHLRTSYTTRDIDFIRQVFSDNALIIVGHTIKTGSKETAGSGSRKVSYAIRSKKEYIERLERIFSSNSKIDVGFSDFKILRHPTMKGIYGVTLRQKYSCDSYSDDGFLFLLWDFRDRSMPLIHVRTWQPAPDILDGGEDVIEIGDFNLE